MAQLPKPANVSFAGEGHEIAHRNISPAHVPDAMALLVAFRRRWPLAIFGGLLAAVLVAAAAWFIVPAAKYKAIGTIRVAMMRPKILFNTAEQETEYQTFQKTQTSLIKTRRILDAVVRDPEVAKLETIKELIARQIEPAEWLDKEVLVEFANKSEILQILMSGERPLDTETIVNKVIDMYMKMVIDDQEKDRLARVETLRKLWTKYYENLDNKRQLLRKRALVAGSDDKQILSIKGQLSHEQLAMVESERMRVQSELGRIEAELMSIDPEKSTSDPAPVADDRADLDRAIDAEIERDAMVRDLRAAFKKSSDQFESASRIARSGGDPSVISAGRRRDGARKSLAARRDELRPLLASKPDNLAILGPGGNSAVLRKKKEVLKRFEKVLTTTAERLTSEIRTHNENTLDLQTDQEEIAMLAETAKKVGSEVEAMDVELQAPKRIEVIDRAKAPRTKDDLKKLRVTGSAAVGTFAIFLLGITFWEAQARRVNSAQEVEKSLGIRLVGSLPALHGRAAPSDRAWQSVLIDSVDATRTMLLHASRMESIRVVMVTSALAGEGKSSLSCHLAASLARAGRKTLLIDCDMRRPSVHRLFDQPQGPGVGELLRGEAEAIKVIRRSHATDLDLIVAGGYDELAVQALARGDLQKIFDTLRPLYDFIIVDSTPILPVVDSLLVSQHVDAVLFSILREVSRIPAVQDARDRLTSLGVRILGAIVSGIGRESYTPRYTLAPVLEGSDQKSQREV